MTPEEKAEKREAAIQGMISRGYSREKAEEAINRVARVLFGPGGPFAPTTEEDVL